MLAPVTLVAGPFVAYNVASVLMPVLAAWLAFRLCRYLTGSFGPAFVGGLVFGFGTYMSAHLLGHLNLTSVFLAPAAVLLVLQRLDDVISQRRFVVLMAVVFGVAGAAVGRDPAAGARGRRAGAAARLRGLGRRAARPHRARGSRDARRRAAIAMIVASPYLYWTLHGLGDADSDAWKTFTDLYPGDALNPLLPTEVTWIGHSWFEDTTSKFTNFTPSEAAAYVGPVLLGDRGRSSRSRAGAGPPTRVLVAVIVVCYVLSLGTELHVGGDDTGVWMPWALLHPLPVLDHVISTRFWAFALLAIAIVVALWLAEPSPRRGREVGGRGRGRAAADPEPLVGLLGRAARPTRPSSDRRLQAAHRARARRCSPCPTRATAAACSGRRARACTSRWSRATCRREFPPGYRDDPFFGTLFSGQVAGEDAEGLRDFLARRQVTPSSSSVEARGRVAVRARRRSG